jgi:hypothetical protein
MKATAKSVRFAVTAAALALCSGLAFGETMKVTLGGDQENPPVKTTAGGTGEVTVAADKTITGSFKITGLQPTAAHIHEGEMGKNGPVAIPLTKGADGSWTVAPGTKLTDAQLASLKAGKLYVNFHTAANPGGEIRGQIK